MLIVWLKKYKFSGNCASFFLLSKKLWVGILQDAVIFPLPHHVMPFHTSLVFECHGYLLFVSHFCFVTGSKSRWKWGYTRNGANRGYKSSSGTTSSSSWSWPGHNNSYSGKSVFCLWWQIITIVFGDSQMWKVFPRFHIQSLTCLL